MSNPPEPFPERLKRRRAELGLSQAQLASRAGIEQSQVSKLERGLDVRLSTLMKILTALDLELDPVPRTRSGQVTMQSTPLPLLVASGMAPSAGEFTPAPGTLLDRFGIPDDDEPADDPAIRVRRKNR